MKLRQLRTSLFASAVITVASAGTSVVAAPILFMDSGENAAAIQD